MKLKKVKKSISYRDLSYKALLFIATVAVIVYFMPRDSKFNYQFDIDKPWKYGQLIATFDFPIYKSDEVVKHEQDSLLSNFQPYYQINPSVKDSALQHLQKDYETRLHRILPSENYLKYLIKKISYLYDAGILSTEDQERLRQDSTVSILVIKDKIASTRNLKELHSVKEAYAYLLNADTAYLPTYVLSQCSLNEYLLPNLILDQSRTETARQDILNNYPWAKGMVVSGQKIIDRGEIITPETYNILLSLQKESIKRSETVGQKRLTLVGQILFVCIFMLCFMLYLDLFRKDYYGRKGCLALLFTLIMFYCVVTAFMVSHGLFNVYILPYAMLPAFVRVFLDSRTAFIAHITTILICSICLRYPHDFILLQTTAGLVAIYSLRELSQRSQLFKTAFFVFISYAATYFAFELIIENDVTKLNASMFTYFFINGIFLLFTYPLMFLVEKTFGFTSNVTLVELSNINTPLLRRMSETVPGTFQHSMQVANLAAAAANSIEANSQLVRTGALYHDIGKMEHPVFFTENQLGGINPHKRLNYEQSAQVVISHVTDGLKLAEKNNLPKVIKDFIVTHHGKGKTKYFYISWKNEHPDEEPNETLFTYPGPNPFTKEQAILMMADAVEAASRSLPEYTEESISCLVEKIIDSQLEDGFFKECPITFKDIDTVKAVFKEKLKTMYHTRISYPELKQQTNKNA